MSTALHPHQVVPASRPLRWACVAVLGLLAQAAAWAQEGRSYTPGPFEGLQIEGTATVQLLQGEPEQVFVAGDAQAQRQVSLELRNGTLHVRPAGSWKFWRSERPQLTVTVRNLAWLAITGAADVSAPGLFQVPRLAVQIAGAGQVRAEQLRTEQLDFNVTGSGDGRFAGHASQLSVQISGRGSFDGEALLSPRTRVSISGLGDAKVWATQELGISVAGVGEVEFWGSPAVQRRSVSGRASVVDRGPKAAAQR